MSPMASSKILINQPKHNNYKKKRVITTLNHLPTDLLVEIICNVGSSSSTDLFTVRKTCKEFLSIASEDKVWQQVSLEKLPFNIAWLKPGPKAFFLNCIEKKNVESLFRQGMYEFFSGKREDDHDSGLERLRVAATKGHMEAKYICNVILGGCCEKIQKMPISQVLTCRKNVQKNIESFWINYERVSSLKNICWNRGCECSKSAIAKKKSWPLASENQEYDYFVCSDSCIWSLEPILLCDHILQGRF